MVCLKKKKKEKDKKKKREKRNCFRNLNDVGNVVGIDGKSWGREGIPAPSTGGLEPRTHGCWWWLGAAPRGREHHLWVPRGTRAHLCPLGGRC